MRSELLPENASVRIELGKTRSAGPTGETRERVSVGTHGNRIHKTRTPPRRDVTRRGEASPLAGQRRSRGDGSCQFVLSHRDYLPLLLFTLSCERQRHSYGLAIVSALICNGRDRSASLVGFDLAMFGNSSRLSRIFGASAFGREQ